MELENNNVIETLFEKIAALEKLSDEGIFAIVVFILKMQQIEHALKYLYRDLENHISSKAGYIKSSVTKKKVEVSDEDIDNITLGILIKKIGVFGGIVTDSFKHNLGLLRKQRNQFVHKLFTRNKTYLDLVQEARSGILLANIISTEIEDLSNTIWCEESEELVFNEGEQSGEG